MTRSPFTPVSEGAELDFSATEHNAFIEAALAHRGRFASTDGRGRQPFGAARLIVHAKNNTGADRAFGDIAAIDQAAYYLPQELYPDTLYHPSPLGTVPTAATRLGAFGVWAEPVPAGESGPLIVAGMATAHVQIPTGRQYRFADILPGDATKLTCCSYGTARILSQVNTGDPTWCQVLLGQRTGLRHFELKTGYGTTNNAMDMDPGATAPVTASVFALQAGNYEWSNRIGKDDRSDSLRGMRGVARYVDNGFWTIASMEAIAPVISYQTTGAFGGYSGVYAAAANVLASWGGYAPPSPIKVISNGYFSGPSGHKGLATLMQIAFPGGACEPWYCVVAQESGAWLTQQVARTLAGPIDTLTLHPAMATQTLGS